MIRSLVRLIRIPNLLFLGILIWVMEYWVAIPVLRHAHWEYAMPWWVVMLIIVSTLFIAAGGYVINDYFDIKIDRINRPEKVIISNTLSKDQALWFYRILTVLGVLAGGVVAWAVSSWHVLLLIIIVVGLLWFYSASYKRQFLVGNLVIACLGTTPILLVLLSHLAVLRQHYGAIMAYTDVPQQLCIWMLGFAAFACLGTWIREMMKDMEDQNGDRELECHSLPIVLGDNPTRGIITALMVLMMTLAGLAVFQWLPFPHHWTDASVRFLVFGLWTPMAADLVLLWCAKIPSDYRSVQQVMRLILFLGTMFSYVIMRLI